MQPQRGQLAAPDAAGIERDQVRPQHQPQRRPVAEHYRDVGALPLRYLEPRHEAGRRRIQPFLGGEFHFAVGAAKAQPGQAVDNAAQPRAALQRIVPAQRRVAVHLAQEIHPGRAAQRGFDFAGQRPGLRGAPLRQYAGMHQQVAIGQVRQRPVAQPVEQFVAVRRGQDVGHRVGTVRIADAVRDRQQVQIVVAEHHGGARAERLDAAQRRQRLRPAVDQVAGEPERGTGVGGIDALQQCFQAGVATLQVADRISGGHGKKPIGG